MKVLVDLNVVLNRQPWLAILRICNEVVFIDPHFGPQKGRHIRPFEAFQLALLQGRSRSVPARIEVHAGGGRWGPSIICQ